MSSLSQLIAPGTVVAFAGITSVPSGWLLCDGSAVSRSTFKNLFTYVGVTYGIGDGSTTFNLPNLVDRVIMGTHSYLAANFNFGRVGTSLGANTVTLTTSHIPQHNHSLTASTNFHAHTTQSGTHSHASASFPHQHAMSYFRQNKIAGGDNKLNSASETSGTTFVDTNNVTGFSSNVANVNAPVENTTPASVTGNLLDTPSSTTAINVRQSCRQIRYIIKS
jgi:microcystin-dependent protein